MPAIGDVVWYFPEAEHRKAIADENGDVRHFHPDDPRTGTVAVVAHDEMHEVSKGSPMTAKVVRVRDNGNLDIEVPHPIDPKGNPWRRLNVPFGKPSTPTVDRMLDGGRRARIAVAFATAPTV